jgi:hydroxyacylglutathione hydrolase
MHQALSYLGTLPDATIVYNGHEYTESSAAFGVSVDPENQGLKKLRELTQERKKTDGVTTGLTTIGEEKQWNVFMRLDTEAVK